MNKSILDLPDHEAQEARFLSFFIFNALRALKMAVRPCTGEPLNLFRGSLEAKRLFRAVFIPPPARSAGILSRVNGPAAHRDPFGPSRGVPSWPLLRWKASFSSVTVPFPR